MIDLSSLNPAQLEAVQYCDGPSLVIAGAGSGKTRVLTYKIAYLLDQGMEPWRILALTFTNKAADEMKSRIASLVGLERARHLYMGTFHSVFARILRSESQRIGFTSDFTIYDAADSKSLIKAIIREMNLDDKQYKDSTVQSHISAAKNRLLLPDAYRSNAEVAKADFAARIPATGDIYKRYWARCRQSNAMDFDDLLLYTFLLFRHFPEVRAHYEERFNFVLVDEYQDTNYAQHAIVWQLTEHKQRVCVVGDDAQSIYSFRGANIDNILGFQQLYAGSRLFKLEQNYRSTQTIVNAANSLITHNHSQIKKDVFSKKDVGQPISIYGYSSDIEEASGVAKKILNLNQYDHIPYSKIAILYRTNAQSRSFEEAFRKVGVPYRIFGSVSFYQRAEIKNMIAYFRLVVNPNDEEALKRIINYPARGIGKTTLQKIIDTAQNSGVSLWTVITQQPEYHLDISAGTISKLNAFVQLINSFRNDATSVDAATLGQRIANESGVVAEVFRGREPEDMSRQENLQELLDGMRQFVNDRREEQGEGGVQLTHYLQEVSLLSDLDESNDDSTDKLSLMTVHAAKGLEFRVVFVVGLEDDLFPNKMASSSAREMEEERRLFYVALTRAEEQCFLTYAKNRYRYGNLEFSTPSKFLYEIDSRYIKQHESTSSRPRTNSYSSFRDFSTRFESPRPIVEPQRPPSTMRRVTTSASIATPVDSTMTTSGILRVGQHIEHARFGHGEIIALAGSGIDAKATVRFYNVGTKQLLLRFAKFNVLD